ncbi:MAG: RDD family protein [Actinobacteria bacterium]|nr:RDD family protein [Actinomycetota bacterium]MBW3650488.1 RDD family protein [Actinomycetota bacterium]
MSDMPPPPPPPPPPGGFGASGGVGDASYGGPPLAEVGPRVVAFLIDWIAIPFGIYVAGFILAAIVGIVSDVLGFFVSLITFVAVMGYAYVYIPMQEGNTGQTIGKKMQNVKLVGLENGSQPVGFGMAFVRNFVNGLICGLGWLLPFFDAQKQTLGDKVSKSVVVNA